MHPAHLLTWNPSIWPIDYLDRMVATIAARGETEEYWSTACRSIKPGRRLWLLRQGVEPRGIVGAGHATGEPVRMPWGDGRHYVPLVFQELTPTAPLVHLDVLDRLFPTQNWRPRASGSRVTPPVDELLEHLINHVLQDRNA